MALLNTRIGPSERARLTALTRAASVVHEEQQLDEQVRQAADELIVIGSQAILGQFPDAPAELCVSTEADIYPKNHPERSSSAIATRASCSATERSGACPTANEAGAPQTLQTAYPPRLARDRQRGRYLSSAARSMTPEKTSSTDRTTPFDSVSRSPASATS